MKDTKLSTKAISPNIKKLAISLIIFLGIVICFIVVYKFGLGKINKQKSDIKKVQKNITTLTQKYNTLLKVEETLSKDIQFFSIVLPDSNSSLVVMHQVKLLSLQNGLFLKNIKTGGESKSKKYSRVDLSFEITGNLAAIFNFLDVNRNSAPIVSLDKFDLKQSGGIYKANIGLTSYWAAFPKSIPAITQPIGDFSDKEIETITKIANMSMPQFSTLLPQEDNARVSPFE